MAKEPLRIKTALCADKECQRRLHFSSNDEFIYCVNCGQTNEQSILTDAKSVECDLLNVLKEVVMNRFALKKGPDMIKVVGLSNYHCKLISPLLTTYGMDRISGEAKLLSEMGKGDMFDCGGLSELSFLIERQHIPIMGYGRDLSGSTLYLHETLWNIQKQNSKEDSLIPIHADGDGHCLVHAISRALTGRELFWHPLRCQLKKNFEDNISTYKELIKDFIAENDWNNIIDECKPDFKPPEGEFLGLRQIHIFGLANVLKRPIILLDSFAAINSSAGYTGVFLPATLSPDQCKGKNGSLNKPLCIAWSSSGHNHYIPLVGIKGASPPVLHKHNLPKVWGVSQSLLMKYIEFNDEGFCTIGGVRSLGENYILRLSAAMDKVFEKKYGVLPMIVADHYHYVFHKQGAVSVPPEIVIQATKKALSEKRLYRCLKCDALRELPILPDWLRKGGLLYKMAVENHSEPDLEYTFSSFGMKCRYDHLNDELILIEDPRLENCLYCHSDEIRLVGQNGVIQYLNGDKTLSPSHQSSSGYKYFWEGKEYDSLPQNINVRLDWRNKTVNDTVYWFENQSNPSLNSNVYDEASHVVQKHFPGVFGSETLVQSVVEQILEQTKSEEMEMQDAAEVPEAMDTHSEFIKCIIPGPRTLHKEELGVSQAERDITERIKKRASFDGEQRKHKKVNESDNMKKEKEFTKPVAEMPKKDDCRFVRVTTSDGRQGKLELGPEPPTFRYIQNWIEKQFDIMPYNQSLKHGFPPREIKPPESAGEDFSVELTHGDRLTVEITDGVDWSIHYDSVMDTDLEIAINKELFSQPVFQNDILGLSDLDDPWDQEEQNCEMNDISVADKDDGSEAMLTSLLNSLETVKDPLDLQILRLQTIAKRENRSLWEYVQSFPTLFLRGGQFYMQVQRDLGLKGGNHFLIPVFPDKVFTYNAEHDRIEICLEPLGHFPIEAGLEEKILSGGELPKENVHFLPGTSGAISNVPSKNSYIPFKGAGHSLKALEIKTSHSTSCSTPKVSTNSSSEDAVFQRKGPGYSVLIPKQSSENKDNLEKIKNDHHISESSERLGMVEEKIFQPPNHSEAVPTVKLMAKKLSGNNELMAVEPSELRSANVPKQLGAT